MDEYRSSTQTPYHISCGGPVFRLIDNVVHIALLKRDRKGVVNYHLPKGTLKRGESLEACAEREVLEETGIIGKIGEYLGAFTDEFTSKGIFRSKTTHYFVIKFQSQSDQKDDEHEEVLWMPIEMARIQLKKTEPKKKEYIILDRLQTYLAKIPVEVL